jgi:hypothetical protein
VEELLKHELAESVVAIFWRNGAEMETTVRLTKRPSMAGY